MTNYVFFNAVDATVKVTVNDAVIGYADDTAGLVEMFLRTGLTSKDTFMHSSDVDFASEEGFGSDNAAHAMIEQALDDAGLL